MHKLQYLTLIIVIILSSACGSPNTTVGKADTTTTPTQPAQAANTKTILFFGDSLTAGYGLDDPQAESFPALIQAKLDSAKLPYKVINGGLSGETTAGGRSRIDWLLKQRVDIFILELGANDGLRGLQTAETQKNLQAIVDKVKAKYPQAKLILTGMMVPPNMGADYANAFKAVFPAVAKKNNMAFLPFLLQNVAGIKDLNQADGIHPTAKGAKIVANNVWGVLKGEL
ncbi:acyl-CoA thioesterase-1 [Mucilaginibacter gracilis]|uniref:Acyl-CoA thioesterase-1 n=1 Tax=Mucilaginibacter gracilis TaxID=423350 RepID=A0A495J9S2_9SPHI|nr:arylesterase [Mucilaginibacter gracilis]RKR84809.1 acyl-CoA thioesterase-1 [Mucilaginibacter gracilis]